MRPPTFPRHPDPDADGERFVCNDAAADASTAASIRAGFANWLRRAGLDEPRLCDIVLALNEALSNVAEFAYPDGPTGRVDVQAALDRDRCTLTVTVADRGQWREEQWREEQGREEQGREEQWRESGPSHPQRRRGRGIPLMRALADALVIDTSAVGTTVVMRFDTVDVRRRVAALGT